MPPRVLIGSSSPCRQACYENELVRQGLHVHVVPPGVDCLRELASSVGSVLLTEWSLLWGSVEVILDLSFDDSDWKGVLVVLLANHGMEQCMSPPIRFPICGIFDRFPERNELAAAIRSVFQSPDLLLD